MSTEAATSSHMPPLSSPIVASEIITKKNAVEMETLAATTVTSSSPWNHRWTTTAAATATTTSRSANANANANSSASANATTTTVWKERLRQSCLEQARSQRQQKQQWKRQQVRTRPSWNHLQEKQQLESSSSLLSPPAPPIPRPPTFSCFDSSSCSPSLKCRSPEVRATVAAALEQQPHMQQQHMLRQPHPQNIEPHNRLQLPMAPDYLMIMTEDEWIELLDEVEEELHGQIKMIDTGNLNHMNHNMLQVHCDEMEYDNANRNREQQEQKQCANNNKNDPLEEYLERERQYQGWIQEQIEMHDYQKQMGMEISNMDDDDWES